jgi:uncharacterized protein YjbI with pentapeptide repeats
MANKEHLRVLNQGVKVWNEWRKMNPNIRPNLRKAKLIRADLAYAHLANADISYGLLGGADLRKANLQNAKLAGVSLVGADLDHADLTESYLLGAEFTYAQLRNANLHGSSLVFTKFRLCDMSGANLTHATMDAAEFIDIDLSTVIGLETVEHRGPSTIGTNSLYRSHGAIPRPFLRGLGVPEDLISFVHSLRLQPVEASSCFISYSTRDQKFAELLYGDLQLNGIRCWFAPHDVKGGEKLHEQIEHAIRLHDHTLLILSPNSINSTWVKTEIAKARKREIEEQRQILFPIRLVDFETLRKWEYFDADYGADYAKEIREYFIPDFSNWKRPKSYKQAFKALLRDLKNERTKAARAPEVR